MFPPADTPALAAAMQRFMDDPAAGAREAAERFAYVRPRFSIAHMTDQIEALYRQVLAARRGQR
jgi:glycosyltransferase involved in cell wall biosynthesis